MERNYRCQKGELDLVLGKERRLLFVEVRSLRGQHEPCRAMASVVHRKRCRLLHAAQHYLAAHDVYDCEMQFEVCGVIADAVGSLSVESWKLDVGS